MLWVGDPVAGVRLERVPEPVAGGAFPVAWKADSERAKRSREDPSRAAWGLRRGPGTTPARRGGRPGGRCRDPTRPEGHRFAPRPHRAAGGRDPSVKGGSMNKPAGIQPPPSPWRQPDDRGQPERVSPWGAPDERGVPGGLLVLASTCGLSRRRHQVVLRTRRRRAEASPRRTRAGGEGGLRHLPGQGPLRGVCAPTSRVLRRLGWADGERTRLPVEPGSGPVGSRA